MSPALIEHPQPYGHPAIFEFLASESPGIPMPGETTLIAVALSACTPHRRNIALIAIAAVGAAIIGHLLGSRGGRRLIRLQGRGVRPTPQRLAAGRDLFGRHGGKGAFHGRFLSGPRTFAACPCGPGALLVTR
jgi:membrane protein DedA with SNARE-associated domain